MQGDKNRLGWAMRGLSAIALSGALALAAGCHGNSSNDNSANSAANSGPDPAAANLAPANGQTQVMGENAAYTPQQQGENYQQAPAPVQQGYAQQPYYPSDAEQAGEEALDETQQAPPPLPEYDQPQAPGPNYIWTPGYWAWGPGGYYWVPGAWVEAPYYGALWTPPYWGWSGGYYRFHRGYWGPHIGFYGGVDYGYGYIGTGYFGGYWSGNNFYYNRAVTRVGPSIRTAYERPVVYNNVHYGMQPSNRVSYNGGHGGIDRQPSASEAAAMRERHDPPMAVQQQARVQASQNRAQSFAANGGRPAQAAVEHGIANPHGIAAPPRGVEPARTAAPMNERAAAGNPAGARVQPNAAAPRVENRPGQPQPNVAGGRMENRPTPQPNVAANRPGQPQPNAANPRVENRAAAQPQPRPEYRAAQPNAAAPRVENRPAPQPAPRVEARPAAPAPRVESRPAPQARAPQAAPAHAAPAHPAPAPQQHGGGGRPEDHR